MTSASDTSGMDRAELQRHIPHRDPFLFLDELVERGEDWLLARWRIPEDGWWFQGHYPDAPVMPGVLITEHTLQGGALLVAAVLGVSGADAEGRPRVPVVTRIRDARFRRMLKPGAELFTRVELRERVSDAFYLVAKVQSGGKLAARVEFTVTATAGQA